MVGTKERVFCASSLRMSGTRTMVVMITSEPRAKRRERRRSLFMLAKTTKEDRTSCLCTDKNQDLIV